MYMDEIVKMFYEDVREKKRIGNNIFSRVSTRRGGSKQALRTPYLFMSNKERKSLNGKVESYNMNEVLNYHEFIKRPKEEQFMLLTRWRELYKSQDVQEKMGISRTAFYNLLNKLGIQKKELNLVSRKRLTDDEMSTYMKEMMPFDEFKLIHREQQLTLLGSYLQKYGSVKNLAKEWENADESYLYNIRRYERNKMRAEKARKLRKQNEETVATANNTLKPDVVVPENTIKNDEDKTIGNSSNIIINGNSFNFELKGEYNAKTILKRVQLALDVIDDEDSLFDIEIRIRQK